MRPDSTARFLEVVIVFRRDADHPSNAERLELDLARDVSLVSTAGGTLKAAGTVTEIFGQKTLVAGAPARISAQPAETETPTALAVTLAFKIAADAGGYMLQLDGFTPVRIWVPPAE